MKTKQPKIINIKIETLQIFDLRSLETPKKRSKPFIEVILDIIAEDESLMQMLIDKAKAISV